MKKNIIKISIIVVVSILILTGAALAYLYIATDTFKSNKDLFEKYSKIMLKNMQTIIQDENIKNYEKRKLSDSYENKGDIEVAIQAKTNTDQISTDTTIMDFNAKVDNKTKNLQGNVNIHYADDVKFPMEFVKNDEKYAITSNEIMKAYAVVENKNLDEFLAKLGIDSDNITSEILQVNTKIEFNENDLSVLEKKYMDIIVKNLTLDDFSKEDSVKNGYVLKVPATRLKTIALEMINQMKDDEIILDYIRKSSTDENNDGESSYKNKIDELVESINEIDETTLDGKYLTITIYETLNGITTSKITFEEVVVQIDTSDKSIKVSIFEKDDEVLSIDLTKEGNDNTVNYDLNMSIVNIKTNNIIDSDSISDVREEKIQEKSLVNTKYEIAGLNTNSISEKLTIIYNNDETDAPVALGTVVKSDTEFNDNIEILELNEGNSVILNDLSRDTLVTTLQQVLNKVIELNTTKIAQAKQSDKPSAIIIIMEKVEQMQRELINNARRITEQNRTREEELQNQIEQPINNLENNI